MELRIRGRVKDVNQKIENFWSVFPSPYGLWAWITHVICSPVLSSCGLTLFVGKACFFAVPLVWLVALVMPRLNRSL